MSRVRGNPIIARRIGRNMLRYREAQGLKQAQCSIRTGKLSTSEYASYERGEKIPQYGTFLLIAQALGIEPEQLLDPEDIADARARAVAAAKAGALLRDSSIGTPPASPDGSGG